MGRPKGSKNGHVRHEELGCQICGVQYQVEPHRVSVSKFCSKKCQGMGKRALKVDRGIKRCVRCQKEFPVIPSNQNSNRRIYCNRACADASRRSMFLREKSPRWSPRITSNCKVCKKTIVDTEHRDRIVCSKECANKSFERKGSLVCPVCHKSFEVIRSLLGSRKTCSRKCRTEYISKNDTSIEIAIEAILKKYTTYIKQMPLGTFLVDFAIPEKRVLIECDGTYWHSLPGAINRDSRKDRLASEGGWTMLRLSEQDITKDIHACETRIKEALCF